MEVLAAPKKCAFPPPNCTFYIVFGSAPHIYIRDFRLYRLWDSKLTRPALSFILTTLAINNLTIGEYAMNSSFKNIINSPVTITAIGFDRRMQAYPKRMEWNGTTYYFVDRGLRVRRGEQGSCTLTMSDGRHSFCLRERVGNWTLVSIS